MVATVCLFPAFITRYLVFLFILGSSEIAIKEKPDPSRTTSLSVAQSTSGFKIASLILCH